MAAQPTPAKAAEQVETGRVKLRLGEIVWLPTRDSNPNMLLQRQLSYH